MTITSIRQQIKRIDRFSVYVDGKYSFSLGEAALLISKINSGQDINEQRIRELKQLADGDKFYNQASRYVILRPHTKWEIDRYLQRKQASPTLINEILNKLSNIGLIDDAQYARSYIHDRKLLRPTSRRKIRYELRKKYISDKIIEEVMSDGIDNEQSTIRLIIERKRQQSRYQDDLKLMQYLARQGFHYGDIKEALKDIGSKP